MVARLLQNPEEWRNTAISLQNPLGDDRWVYILQFKGKPKTRWQSSEALETLAVVVLMNGQALEPRPTSIEEQGGEWRSQIEVFDWLFSARNRQMIVPGTNFVLLLLEDDPGQGPLPKAGDRVEIRVVASLKGPAGPSPIGPKTLRFRLGSGEVGKGVESMLDGMAVGGKRTVEMREEIAQGIRESWKDLAPESQIDVTIGLLRVNPD